MNAKDFAKTSEYVPISREAWVEPTDEEKERYYIGNIKNIDYTGEVEIWFNTKMRDTNSGMNLTKINYETLKVELDLSDMTIENSMMPKD